MPVDTKVLLGAKITAVSYETEEDEFVSHVILETMDGKRFTMTGWTYGDYPCPLVIKEGIYTDEDGNDFRNGVRYE